MPHFPSEQLLTFATVLSEGTLDAAARLLHITPSAVSQRLKALEQSTGSVLLQRSNPAKATEAGEVVLRLARQVAQLEADAGRELGLGADGAQLAVPIVVNADSLAVWFLQALAKVPADLNVTFDLHRDDEQHSTSLLRSGTVMAAVTATPEPVQGCRVESLGVMRYRAVAAPHFVDRWFPELWEGLDSGSGLTGAALNAATTVDFDRKDTYQWAFVQSAFKAEGDAASGTERTASLRPGFPGLRRCDPFGTRLGANPGSSMRTGNRRRQADRARPRPSHRCAALLATLANGVPCA